MSTEHQTEPHPVCHSPEDIWFCTCGKPEDDPIHTETAPDEGWTSVAADKLRVEVKRLRDVLAMIQLLALAATEEYESTARPKVERIYKLACDSDRWRT